MSAVKIHELLSKKRFHIEQADLWVREFAVAKGNGTFETIVDSDADALDKVFFDTDSRFWCSAANRIYLEYCQQMCQFHIKEARVCDIQLNKLRDYERDAENSYTHKK